MYMIHCCCYDEREFVFIGATSRFTGKERDETGFDYFGARYFSGSMGRFTSPDPLMTSAVPDEPEAWNRYSYVTNNPLRFIDENGRIRRDAEGRPIFLAFGMPSGTPTHEGSGIQNYFQPGFLIADNGDPIYALQNITNDHRFDTNCHGSTFADSMYWINGDMVGPILWGDSYAEYDDTGSPDKYDIGTYQDINGSYKHSVTLLTPELCTERGCQVTGKG